MSSSGAQTQGRRVRSAILAGRSPGFPDTNPCLFIDPQKRLWLFWQAILANKWETALCRYQISRHYVEPGAPVWDKSDLVLFKPGDAFGQP